MDSTKAIAGIAAVVKTYVEGMLAGDRAALQDAFFEQASEVGHFEGALLWNSRDAFIGMCEEAADRGAIPDWTIRSVSVHGDIAVVHVEDVWAGMRFDDLLTLIRHEDRWRIVAKVYRIQA